MTECAECICGFELLEPFHSRNAGFSVWTFARRDGRDYFIKQFLDPVYPEEGTGASHTAQLDYCKQFEQEKIALYRMISQASDGNLIRPQYFFRSGSKYYLAMDKAVAEKQAICDLCKRKKEDVWLVCLTAAHALSCLHEKGIVHSDIKPENLILHRSEAGHYVAKLVDFDASFFADHPPEPEQIHFDEAYLAPETALYLAGEYDEIQCSADVFSMGLLFHQILTGTMPEFDHSEFGSPFEVVLAGAELSLASELDAQEKDLLGRMLRLEPSERCTMDEVYQFFARRLAVPEKKKKHTVVGFRPAEELDDPVETDHHKGKRAEKSMGSWFHTPEL